MSSKEKTFEQTLASATEIIQEIEQGELSLDELISKHKLGRELLADCAKMLEVAEKEFLETTTELNETMKSIEK